MSHDTTALASTAYDAFQSAYYRTSGNHYECLSAALAVARPIIEREARDELRESLDIVKATLNNVREINEANVAHIHKLERERDELRKLAFHADGESYRDLWKLSHANVGRVAKRANELRALLVKAGEALPLLSSIHIKLAALSIASCTCETKSHEAHWHEPTCTFRQIEECLEHVEAVSTVLAEIRRATEAAGQKETQS